MYLTIIFLPLFGSIVAGLFGRYVGAKGATLVTTSCLFLALFLSFFAFYEALQARVIELNTAAITGFFEAAPAWVAKEQGLGLKEIEGLNREISELRVALKMEKQMSRKITLNTEIRKHKDAIIKLEKSLTR